MGSKVINIELNFQNEILQFQSSFLTEKEDNKNNNNK